LAAHSLETGPWIVLYDIEFAGSTWYITSHQTPVIRNGIQYTPWPIRWEVIEQEERGKLGQVVLHVANVTREPQYYLEQYDGLRGAKVTIRVVHGDDPEGIWVPPETFTVDSAVATAEVATLVLGKPVPVWQVRVPQQIITRDLFPAVP
jgi:phage-related protein